MRTARRSTTRASRKLVASIMRGAARGSGREGRDPAVNAYAWDRAVPCVSAPRPHASPGVRVARSTPPEQPHAGIATPGCARCASSGDSIRARLRRFRHAGLSLSLTRSIHPPVWDSNVARTECCLSAAIGRSSVSPRRHWAARSSRLPTSRSARTPAPTSGPDRAHRP